MNNTERLPYSGICGYCGDPGLIIHIDPRNEMDIPICKGCREYGPKEAENVNERRNELAQKHEDETDSMNESSYRSFKAGWDSCSKEMGSQVLETKLEKARKALDFYARVGVPRGCTPTGDWGPEAITNDPYWQDQGRIARSVLQEIGEYQWSG